MATSGTKTASGSRAKDRAARRAEALKANLRRRKAQARARAAGETGEPDSGPGPDGSDG